MSRALFISDLHLSAERPATSKQFFGFLREQAARADALYILGDLFEYWAGDDDTGAPFNAQVCAAIGKLTARGIQMQRGGRSTRVTPEQIEAEGNDLLAALTKGWKLVDLDGNPIDVPFSQENARELYALTAVAWLRDQVDEYIGDRANFSKASSKS